MLRGLFSFLFAPSLQSLNGELISANKVFYSAIGSLARIQDRARRKMEDNADRIAELSAECTELGSMSERIEGQIARFRDMLS